jgi:hypothetical protein
LVVLKALVEQRLVVVRQVRRLLVELATPERVAALAG